jgi:ABC-type transporter Mla subunit MlaD
MNDPLRSLHVNRLVGGFVLVAAGVLVGGVFLVGRAQHWLERPFEVTVVAERTSASGLRPGLPVKIQGRPAGEIIRARRDGETTTTAVASLHEPFRDLVRRDSKAILHTPIAGFLGETFLEIVPGEGSEALRAEDTIRFQPSEDLMEQARQTIIRFGEAAEELRALVAENRSGLTATVAEVRAAAAGVNLAVSDNREAVGRAIVNVSDLARQINDMVTENRPGVKAATAGLAPAIAQATAATTAVTRAADQAAVVGKAAEPAVERIGKAAADVGDTVAANKDELAAALKAVADLTKRLDEVTADLKTISDKVASGEGTLGKLVMSDDLHTTAVEVSKKAEARLDEIKPLLDSVTDLRLAVGAAAGGNAKTGSGTGEVYVRIEPKAWKFMQAGASYRTAPSDRVVSGSSDTTIPIDFTLALGWRFMPASDWSYYHLTLAGGLVENTLGAWTEIPLFTDRLVWRTLGRMKHNDRDPNDRRYEEGNVLLRSMVDFRIWRRLYLTVGGDDLIDPDRGAWFGVRGELYDNDLRNATGVASLFK